MLEHSIDLIGIVETNTFLNNGNIYLSDLHQVKTNVTNMKVQLYTSDIKIKTGKNINHNIPTHHNTNQRKRKRSSTG